MFWRRKREEPAADDAADQPIEPAAPTAEPAEPVDDEAIANDGPWEPDPADFEPEAAWGPGGAAPIETEPEPTNEPIFHDAPEPERVVPTIEPAGSLDHGLARTRGGFMSRLRGFLGGDDGGGPSWDDVEETLIAGDVGAALAMELVERARNRHDPDRAEAAVRAELTALLVQREAGWEPRPAVAGGPAILLIVGVNGTGKTTTIGKLASRYMAEGATSCSPPPTPFGPPRSIS